MPYPQNLIIYDHPLDSMRERRISFAALQRIVRIGEMIERYQHGAPPGYLLLGWTDDRPIHIVAADEYQIERTHIVMVYEPDPDEWDAAFPRRRRS